MAISPTGPVSTLVPDVPQARPAAAPDQPDAGRSAQSDAPTRAVTPPSTDTRIEREAPRDHQVDLTV